MKWPWVRRRRPPGGGREWLNLLLVLDEEGALVELTSATLGRQRVSGRLDTAAAIGVMRVMGALTGRLGAPPKADDGHPTPADNAIPVPETAT